MPVIELLVRAPIDRVFDLSRCVELHTASTADTGERAVAGVTTGLLGPDDRVTWEATHFGIRQRLTTRITRFDRPRHFRDSMVAGAFRRFDHDFVVIDTGTLLRERFDFDSPLGPLGSIANALSLTRYMTAFREMRAKVILDVAESDPWRRFLPAAD